MLRVLLAGLVLPPMARASTEPWTGGDNADSNWTTNGNWSGIGGTGPGDDLIFPQVAARKTNTNDFAVNTDFASLTFNGTSYTIGGNQIRLTGAILSDFPNNGSPAPIFNPNILLAANEIFTSSSAGGRPYVLNGVVNLDGNTLTLAGASDHLLAPSSSSARKTRPPRRRPSPAAPRRPRPAR